MQNFIQHLTVHENTVLLFQDNQRDYFINYNNTLESQTILTFVKVQRKSNNNKEGRRENLFNKHDLKFK